MKSSISIFLILVSHLLSAQALQLKLNDKGVQSLTYGNTELIDTRADASLTAEGYKVIHKGGKEGGGWSQVISKKTDVRNGTITAVFNWGVATCRFQTVRDSLFISLKLLNTSKSDTLCGVNLYPLHIVFSELPKGFIEYYPYYNYNRDAPTAIPVEFGTGKFVLCNEDVVTPVFVGVVNEKVVKGVGYKVWVSTVPFYGLSPALTPMIERKLAPGKEFEYNISLRFGTKNDDAGQIASAIFNKYRKAWPAAIKWKDKSPIGYLVLSSYSEKKNKNNPRNWLSGDIGSGSAQDKKRFENKVLSYADESIRMLREMKAQGMITWDIEGQEFPHAISYIGAPEKIGLLAPEMDAVADKYFKKFRDAGFRVGLCIRPDSVIISESGKTVERKPAADIVQILASRIRYAKKRWGCSLFYIDSNGDPGFPFDAGIFESLNKLCPEVLLIPEHSTARYYAYTAPYSDWNKNGNTLPYPVSYIYGKAFKVINVSKGDFSQIDSDSKSTDDLGKSILQGNIVLYRGWYKDAAEHKAINMGVKKSKGEKF